MERITKILLYLTIISASFVLGANVYNSVVDVPNWGAKIPESLIAARSYMSVANPGNFFRIFSPLTAILAILSLIFAWRNFKGIRKYLITAIICMIAGDILTFAFFYPRNEIMFIKPLEGVDVSLLHRILWEWSWVNYLRSILVLVALLSSIKSLVLMHGK